MVTAYIWALVPLFHATYGQNCQSTFYKVADQSLGTSSYCEQRGIYHGNTHTPEQCALLACANGANTFNFQAARPSCEVVYCESNLDLGTSQGPWDVYTNLPGYRPCTMPWRQVVGSDAGVSSSCEQRGIFHSVPSIHECSDVACAQGANAFNFRDTSCEPLYCDWHLELLSYYGAWDVYSNLNVDWDVCASNFNRIIERVMGLSSGCSTTRGTFSRQVPTADICARIACALAANTFNYRSDGDCHVKVCQDGDLELYTLYGGYDVYYQG